MKSNYGFTVGAALMLLLALTPLQAQKTQPLIILDLPNTGTLSGTAASIYTGLRAESFDVWWLRVHEPNQRGREAAAVCCPTGAPLQRELKLQLADYVRQGGGLVYLADSNPARLQENVDFLRDFGVAVTQIKRSGEVQMANHRIASGLEATRFDPVTLKFTSDTLETLATQDNEPVAVAGAIGKGRLVVLPVAMATALDSSHAPTADKVKLLIQSLKWATETAIIASPNLGPGDPATTPPATTDLAPRIVTNLPVIEPWKTIEISLDRTLQPLGLPVNKLTYDKKNSTLSEAAAGRPSLIVISSSREFDDSEDAWLNEYVQSGGSLLVLGHALPNQIAQISALNRLLGEFGIGFTYGRAAGKAILQQHPATAGVGALGKAPAGSAVWATAQWPLAMVGDRALAAAHEVGQGRIVVFDAATLIPATGKGAKDESQTYCDLLAGCVRWLTGR